MFVRLWIFVACLVGAKFAVQLTMGSRIHQSRVSGDLSAEQRVLLAHEMEKTAACMRSNLPTTQCRESFNSACSDLKIQNCGLGMPIKTSQRD